jgi:hypothetical protein
MRASEPLTGEYVRPQKARHCKSNVISVGEEIAHPICIKEYRELHPEYVDRNREQQKERNKKRQKDPVSMIVKTDALLLQPLYDGLYAGFKVKNGKIVKTDAFMLQMQLQQGAEASPLINPG